MEERWEALEQCERLFRATSLRASTANVGLAHVSDHLELLRIGRPLRPELAIWRYGRKFHRRRFATYLQELRWATRETAPRMAIPAAMGVILLAYAPYASPLLVILATIYLRYLGSRAQGIWDESLAQRVVLDATVGGEPMVVRTRHLEDGLIFRLRDSGWLLQVEHDRGKSEVGLDDGMRILAQTLPLINRRESKLSVVRAAVRSIEAVGNVLDYVGQVPERERSHGFRYSPISRYPRTLRVGLEIAAQEEFERRALEGELHRLEAAWREAEEIASIADNLLIPPWIEDWIAREHGRDLANG